MPAITLYLAVEDDLSESALRRILNQRPVEYKVGAVFKKQGSGYLKKKCPAFNNVAKIFPVLLLTDLDQYICVPNLLQDWLDRPKNRNFLLRVAVREVEAWILADDDQVAKFFGSTGKLHYPNPESLSDPKAELLKLALKSPRRETRESLARCEQNGVLRQGPAYNSLLSRFVQANWRPDVAMEKCQSLKRLNTALATLETRFP